MSDDTNDLIEELCDMMDLDKETSRKVLEENHWDILKAVDNLLDSKNNINADDTPPSSPDDTNELTSEGVIPFYSNLYFPFNLIFKALEYLYHHVPIVKPIMDFLWSLIYTPPINPQEDTKKFLKNYQDNFTVLPPFRNSSFSEASEFASKELKFLLVFIDSHFNSQDFCKFVISSNELTSLINKEGFVFWGGDVSFSESFSLANKLEISKFPFLGLFSPVSGSTSKLKMCYKTEGNRTDIANIVSELKVAEMVHSVDLSSLRNDKIQRENERQIRERQEVAYMESLKKDKEKKELMQKEIREKEQAELKKKSREEEKIKRIEEWKLLIPNEPPPNSSDCVKIALRLPDGSRLQRRFFANEKVKILYAFAGIQDLKIENDFILVKNVPRIVLNDQNLTLKEAGVYPAAVVCVEEVFET